jgi:tetratricopeptide (TPR) repeat protein
MSKKTNDPIDTMLEPQKTAADIEKWIKNNAKTVAIALVAVIAIPLGYMGYKKFILEPKENEAYAAMFYAEQYFSQEDFTLALNGNNEFSGFLTIIDEYGGTKAANLANYYAGICCLKLGRFEDAIKHLEDFSSDDILVSSVAAGALGDAYRELGNSEKAVKNYEKAANKYPNNFTSPIFLKKAGMTYEEDLAKPDKALACYEKIEKLYPMSREGQEIIKYISRTKAMMTE